MKVPLSLFRSVTESSMLLTLNELLVGLPILALAGPRIARARRDRKNFGFTSNDF
jgi:hypothetical protein